MADDAIYNTLKAAIEKLGPLQDKKPRNIIVLVHKDKLKDKEFMAKCKRLGIKVYRPNLLVRILSFFNRDRHESNN